MGTVSRFSFGQLKKKRSSIVAILSLNVARFSWHNKTWSDYRQQTWSSEHGDRLNPLQS